MKQQLAHTVDGFTNHKSFRIYHTIAMLYDNIELHCWKKSWNPNYTLSKLLL